MGKVSRANVDIDADAEHRVRVGTDAARRVVRQYSLKDTQRLYLKDRNSGIGNPLWPLSPGSGQANCWMGGSSKREVSSSVERRQDGIALQARQPRALAWERPSAWSRGSLRGSSGPPPGACLRAGHRASSCSLVPHALRIHLLLESRKRSLRNN